jgi:hypothetical protein
MVEKTGNRVMKEARATSLNPRANQSAARGAPMAVDEAGLGHFAVERQFNYGRNIVIHDALCIILSNHAWNYRFRFFSTSPK